MLTMLYRYISYSEERHRTFSNLKKMYLSIDEHEDCIYIYKRLEQLFGVHTFQDICAWMSIQYWISVWLGVYKGPDICDVGYLWEYICPS